MIHSQYATANPVCLWNLTLVTNGNYVPIQQPQDPSSYFLLLWICLCLGTLMCGIILFVFKRLACFTQHNVFKIILCCNMYQDFLFGAK